MLTRYRTVLSVPGSLRLFATGVLARLPQGMASLSILLLVRGATHSYAVAGLAVGGEALASAAAGPVQGRLLDRRGRARVLGPAAVAQAALFVAIALAATHGAPGILLVAIAGAIGAVQPAIAPSVRAQLRTRFSDQPTRESAYALESVVQELIWITGPLLVGVVIAASSPAVAALLCAAVCLLGTGLFLTAPASPRRAPGERPVGQRGGVLRRAPELRALLLPVALMGVSIGASEVGLPSLALHAGSRASTGLLLALWSIGSMLGGLVYGARAWSRPLAERYRILLSLAVVGALPLVFARSIPAGCLAALLTGLTVAPVFSCQYALVGRTVTEGTETEAFTWVTAALVSGIATGSAAGGALIGGLGVGAPFTLAALALALAALSATGARRIAPVPG